MPVICDIHRTYFYSNIPYFPKFKEGAFSCCLVNEEVPQLRRQFVIVWTGETRKRNLERKFVRWVTFHYYIPLLRERCPNGGKKITLHQSGE
jgi:hypothetical protein